MSILNVQDKTIEQWDDLYIDFEKGKPVGIEYPTEALIRFVANQSKAKNDANTYFDDKGKEYSTKRNFSGRALEIGFGSLANLKMVKEKGYEVYGLEVSAEAVNRGKEEINKNELGIKLSKWNPYELPFEENYFDIIYGLQCIYYNLELEKTIEEIYRALVPGGKFLFSFFSSKHTYMDYLEHVEDKIYKWSDKHPNDRLRGMCLRQPNKESELKEIFKNFCNVNVFLTETNQTPLFESWWYITGIKPKTR